MDIKTLLDNAQNRRSLLKGMGVTAVGLTITSALAGCGEKEAKKLANGESALIIWARQAWRISNPPMASM